MKHTITYLIKCVSSLGCAHCWKHLGYCIVSAQLNKIYNKEYRLSPRRPGFDSEWSTIALEETNSLVTTDAEFQALFSKH